MAKEVDDFTIRNHWKLAPITIINELKAKDSKFDIIQSVLVI